MPRLGKKKRFFAKHPFCCFCSSGTKAATTVDHVPPKSSFPDGHWPEEFEFPACGICNEETKKNDQIFGYYALALDFNRENHTLAHFAKIDKLRAGINNNYPDALPNLVGSRAIFSAGPVITPLLAFEITTSPAVRTAITSTARKLTYALYYREHGKVITSNNWVYSASYQPQRPGMKTFTEFFAELLPDQTTGIRSNLKHYTTRFAYKSGVKDDDLFIHAAQFGLGLITWGIVIGGKLTIDNLQEPMRSAPWHRGA
jgi:hypothetical protein